MEEICRIDIDKYACAVSGVIRSGLLILTDNQKEHIIKRRGQDFYDVYSPYFPEIAKDPDYIFADGAHDNTVLASKTVLSAGRNVHLVIRLALTDDAGGMENLIITAIIENDKRYEQRLRNNVPLYKKG